MFYNTLRGLAPPGAPWFSMPDLHAAVPGANNLDWQGPTKQPNRVFHKKDLKPFPFSLGAFCGESLGGWSGRLSRVTDARELVLADNGLWLLQSSRHRVRGSGHPPSGSSSSWKLEGHSPPNPKTVPHPLCAAPLNPTLLRTSCLASILMITMVRMHRARTQQPWVRQHTH